MSAPSAELDRDSSFAALFARNCLCARATGVKENPEFAAKPAQSDCALALLRLELSPDLPSSLSIGGPFASSQLHLIDRRLHPWQQRDWARSGRCAEAL